ncbi:ABC transporter permease [Chloroflexota bacterium]
MVLKNLLRRKGRTIGTLLGIAIGVAAIVALGAMAEGLRAGYDAMSAGSDADLVVTQAGAMDITMGGIDESVGAQLLAWPEVEDVDSMLAGNVQAEGSPYFYLFGYDPEGFAVEHFRVVEGQTLDEARRVRGEPLLLGSGAASSLDKGVGDSLRITGGTFRIIGIYETGDAFEEGGGVIALEDAQSLLLQPRRVGLFYVRLRDASDEARFRSRVERHLPELLVSTTSDFADQQMMVEYMEYMVWGIAGIAILVGGLVMANTLFMSVFEQTQEIGLLRALGWKRRLVMQLILSESLVLSLAGGVLGIGLGVVLVLLMGGQAGLFGSMGTHFTPGLFARALAIVAVLGVVGGAYPAWWASRLLPLEALQYEGGGGTDVPRLLPGGMTLRNLWRRRTRTILTSLGIAVGIAAIVALGGMGAGFMQGYTDMAMGSEIDLMALEADVSDMGYSAIDERVGARLSALSEVEGVAGVGFAFTSFEDQPLFIMMGYHPREFAIQHFKIVEGEPLATNRQIIVGRGTSEWLGLGVGDTVRLSDSTFRVTGIYETGVPLEDNGSVVTLRDAQRLQGRPHQVTMYGIKLRNPDDADRVRAYLDADFPEIDVSLTSEFAENIPDMKTFDQMIGQIAFMALLIGGLGMLNAMLMSVLERTREIGVLRALGWQRRQVVGMILREALALGVIGGIAGIALGVGLASGIALIPGITQMMAPSYGQGLFVRAAVVAVATAVVGGLYPAWRATRMLPIEALRHE